MTNLVSFMCDWQICITLSLLVCWNCVILMDENTNTYILNLGQNIFVLTCFESFIGNFKHFYTVNNHSFHNHPFFLAYFWTSLHTVPLMLLLIFPNFYTFPLCFLLSIHPYFQTSFFLLSFLMNFYTSFHTSVLFCELSCILCFILLNSFETSLCTSILPFIFPYELPFVFPSMLLLYFHNSSLTFKLLSMFPSKLPSIASILPVILLYIPVNFLLCTSVLPFKFPSFWISFHTPITSFKLLSTPSYILPFELPSIFPNFPPFIHLSLYISFQTSFCTFVWT